MSEKQCEHKKWIAQHRGCVPTQSWICAGCDVKMSAGEMLIYTELKQIRIRLRQNDKYGD